MDPPRLSPTQLERVHALFAEALEVEPDAREAFLDDACGDDVAVRDEVRALFAASPDEGDGFLQTSVTAAHLLDAVADPVQVGPYRILHRLGEGGMGVVYRAVQTEPLHREVALKLIKPGMDTARVVARFESERQALAKMDHPGIARIYDAGASEDGRSFFAMQLVEGEPIDRFSARHGMSTRARLELFCRMCDAVQHAHQKGVIHRDLKPSNVLAFERDGAAQVAVIDFGIARAVALSPEERRHETLQHEVLGTLDYMAPEQEAGRHAAASTGGHGGDDVDSRADIYSLGVILYELLAGVRPFERCERPAEGERTLRDRTPRPPSSRVAVGGAPAGELRRALRGELDWITVKALDPDRDRRYASASELAADVRRYLAHEPVLAGPPSATYRLRTFVRRNRVPVVAGAAIAAALLVGAVVAWLALLDAQGQRDAARSASTRLREAVLRADGERDAAVTARRSAERLKDFVAGLLLLTNLENDPDIDKRSILEYASAEIDGALAGDPHSEAEAHGILGRAWSALNENSRARHHLGRAVQILDELPDVSKLELFEALLAYQLPLQLTGDAFLSYPVELRLLALAVDLFLEDHPRLAHLLVALDEGFRGPDRADLLDELDSYTRANLASNDPRWLAVGHQLNRWSWPAPDGSDNASNLRAKRLALEIYEDRLDLPQTSVERLRVRRGLVFVLRADGRVAEAEAELEHVKALLEFLPRGHVARMEVRALEAYELIRGGDVEAGVAMMDREFVRFREMVGDGPAMANSLRYTLQDYESSGAHEHAPRMRRALVDTLVRIPGYFISRDDMRAALGPEHEELVAEIFGCWDRCRETESFDLALLPLLDECDRRFPSSDPRSVVVAGNLVGLVQDLVNAGCTDDGTHQLVDRCVESLRRAESPMFVTALFWQAEVRWRSGRIDEARIAAREGLEWTTTESVRPLEGCFRQVLGSCAVDLGERDEAHEQFQRCYEVFVRELGVANNNSDVAHNRMQGNLRAQGRTAESLAAASERLVRLLRSGSSVGILVRNIEWIVSCADVDAELADLARRAADKACRLAPDDWRCPASLGAAWFRCGEPARAVLALRRAEELRDDDDGITTLYAFLALALADEDPAAARRALERAEEDLGASTVPRLVEPLIEARAALRRR